MKTKADNPYSKKEYFTVSVIIPTYNRSNMLEKALLSLDKLDYPKDKYEAIVVNDGSTDNTENVVKQTAKKVNYKVRYFYQQNKRLSAARNLAISNSKSDVIVSIDDDMLFPSQWLKTLIKPLENPKIGAVGGPSIAPSFATLFQRSVDHCMTTSFVGTGGMIGTTKQSFVKYLPRGGNMAIRKSILDKIGLFDERFIPGEEIELDRRIEKAGYDLGLSKDAIVWHMPRTTLKGFLKQIFSRGVMKIQFWRRYKEAFEFLYIAPMLGVFSLVLLVIASFFSKTFLYIFIASLLIYLLILFADSLVALRRIGNPIVVVLVPILMFLQHFTYGLGTISAFFKRSV